MPIRHVQGNILDSRCQTLVCPVNTVGVMGKGVALQMAKHYPLLLAAYRRACNDRSLNVSRPVLIGVKSNTYVLCLATKMDWRNPSRLDWIDAGLGATTELIGEGLIKSLALPMLGCGAGGLDWKDVRALIYKHFQHELIDIEIYGS